MELTINKEEQQQLLSCIDVAIKSAQNSLQTASVLLPLASKISLLKDDEEEKTDDKNPKKK